MPVGWKVASDDRLSLLKRFAPRYHDIVADHVTLSGEDDDPIPHGACGRVIGHADDGKGVEALVVTVDGESRRPDGGTFHITWSLDRAKGREAVESNRVIDECGYRRVDVAGAFRLVATRW